ncbi:MAG: SUMF1/EgtB/PvdO family nonheme iron enzyme [Pirellulales bacterium]|nr:SUMF1/EgtB/PvdO family nonheme iron enzyme [Pirellulales bacterium]
MSRSHTQTDWPSSHSVTALVLVAMVTLLLALPGFGLCNFQLGQGFITGNGIVVICALAYLVAERRKVLEWKAKAVAVDEGPAPRPIPAGGFGAANADDPDSLVKQMLAQGRFALLLRPQIAATLEEDQYLLARTALEEHMALVPDGEVVVEQIVDDSDDDWDDDEPRANATRVVSVRRFFLDRHPVTNRQYFEFVAAGGYQQTALWDPSILPALLDFVDRSGQPGPRYWEDGCYGRGQENHPVVGVSWHEAAAYARWVGKRLPTDPEWIKAGSWPVPMSDTKRLQRKYPWGEAMDRRRANLWGSGPEEIVDVDKFATGVSVGGVYQLIGNVWEWTAGQYERPDLVEEGFSLHTPLKNLRGGAYDTYFDSQATCQFQSADTALARRRNIGFRLAVGVCDLALTKPEKPEATDKPQDAPPASEEAEEIEV